MKLPNVFQPRDVQIMNGNEPIDLVSQGPKYSPSIMPRQFYKLLTFERPAVRSRGWPHCILETRATKWRQILYKIRIRFPVHPWD